MVKGYNNTAEYVIIVDRECESLAIVHEAFGKIMAAVWTLNEDEQTHGRLEYR